MLNVGVFDSKQRFIDALRSSFGGSTFMLGEKVTSTSVRLLASSKRQILSGARKEITGFFLLR